jgi:hypothetical protein
LHFAAFGDALIYGAWNGSLALHLLQRVKEAWIKLYDDLQREMMRAGGISEDAGVDTGRF